MSLIADVFLHKGELMAKNSIKGQPFIREVISFAYCAINFLIPPVPDAQNNTAEVQKTLEANPNLLLKLPEAEIEQQTRLKQMLVEAKNQRMNRINETMRSELASKDNFKSYGIDLFGYIMALTWGTIMMAIDVWKCRDEKK
jgi:hypothetical protein